MCKLPRTAAEDLLEIVERRYEHTSTLLTSNRLVDDWGKLLGDTAAVMALLDRLLHHAHVLKCGPRISIARRIAVSINGRFADVHRGWQCVARLTRWTRSARADARGVHEPRAPDDFERGTKRTETGLDFGSRKRKLTSAP
jgi:hypothetical protein